MSTVRHPRRVAVAAREPHFRPERARDSPPACRLKTVHDHMQRRTLKFAACVPICLTEDLRLRFGITGPWRIHG